ncbi:hypothetical protein [Streptomyces hydrogenans]|uniref:hypothetical protein n=1 Tax=Streptomyces hydrogenans TaxID=1873719 RepID=UPI0035DB55FF
MSPRPTGSPILVRLDDAGGPRWGLVAGNAVDRGRTDCIGTEELETVVLDRQELRDLVDTVMTALESCSASLASTPGGAGWLYAQHVPVRRFVSEVLRKLLALDTWQPFVSAPGPVTTASYEGLVGLRTGSSREYLSHTVTWSGLAYLLGAEAPYDSTLLRDSSRASTENPESRSVRQTR